MDVDDRDLVRRIALGDSRAMGVLYERHATALYRFALVRAGYPDVAEDVVQETMLAVWRGAAAFRGESPVRTWLFGICRNKVGEALRRRRVPGDETVMALRALDPETGSARGAGEQAEASVSFWEAFSVLSDEHREVLLLVFHHGFSLEETARIIGVPVGTVKSRTYHARRRLEAALNGRPPPGDGQKAHRDGWETPGDDAGREMTREVTTDGLDR